MSGHSHWANIKHYKGAADAKRGKVWSKLSRLIIIASKAGGGDPITNLKLRYAIDKARAISMPKDNIERAIRRGTGEAEGITFEELVYEGFGSGGTAITPAPRRVARRSTAKASSTRTATATCWPARCRRCARMTRRSPTRSAPSCRPA